jgi:hypothetical protein
MLFMARSLLLLLIITIELESLRLVTRSRHKGTTLNDFSRVIFDIKFGSIFFQLPFVKASFEYLPMCPHLAT